MDTSCQKIVIKFFERIAERLVIKNSADTPAKRQGENDWDEADSLPACAEYETLFCFSDRKEEGGIYGIKTKN